MFFYLSSLILSAGRGARMGQSRSKALLEWRGRTFLELASGAVRGSACCADPIVVTGFDAAAVEAEAERLGLAVARNPRPERGLLSSLQTGLRALPPEAEAVLITLVDQPEISGADIQAFVSAYLPRRDMFSLARASVRGKPAHPTLIARAHFDEIWKQEPVDEGASFLFRSRPTFVWETERAELARDIDAPSDYEDLIHAR